MIKESYLANWRNLPEDAIKFAVTRTAKSPLSPSWELLKDYKTGKISWERFEVVFRGEILGRPEARALLREIKKLGEERDVYLVCYEKRPPCHRFILMKMIEELEG